jgi:CRP-like cAMP-binding protein
MVTRRTYSSGEVIISENDAGESAFVIEKGRVAVSKEIDGRKVHIDYMGCEEIFGEMSMIDEKPRSATVVAVEETSVREIHRDNFCALMKESPEEFVRFLKVIFERLREANSKVARLQAQTKSGPAPAEAAKPEAAQEQVLCIEGMTQRAIDAMPNSPFYFRSFPLKVGRMSDDPLVNNGLELRDDRPLQISRHHVCIIRENGKLGVYDRGSQLGATVDHERIGGKEANPGPVFFKDDEGTLVLGSKSSPYRFKVKTIPVREYLDPLMRK